MIRSII